MASSSVTSAHPKWTVFLARIVSSRRATRRPALARPSKGELALPCAIIASVKTWRAAFLVAALWLAPGAGAADDLRSAARDLARRTAGAVGKGEPVAIGWRNL